MSIIADALQPFIPNSVLNASGPIEKTAASDMLILGRAGYNVTYNPDDSFLLDFQVADPIIHALSCDCSRFTCAAFQSLGAFSAEQCSKISLPWDLIKLYYAAFYAGHAILRFIGQSCSYLSDSHVRRINALLSATAPAPAPAIAVGLYHGRVAANSTQLHLRKVGARFGGSHEDFWRVFALSMQEVSQGILTGPLAEADAQQVFAKLDELVGLLRHRGAYGRMSTIRNELQYRHGYEGWLPSSMPKSHQAELINLGCQWRLDPMGVRLSSGRLGDLGEFASVCAFLVGLCRLLVQRVAERSAARSRSFLRVSALRMIQD
ncbi:hypothetical protein [Bradyrhizobium yuanmingense]|uniref:hypothetical protein n=1 Tax=Bradyrhizobium yuanmingense TaxID=108015 RepID=UPI0023B94A09|nr:hypothetical protein [Bradyrhizobium yuanmingense]MDF0498102.1 hypothetical protein [Bradyrhizobium yuanmingense]